MKPVFEKIEPGFGNSFYYRKFTKSCENDFPFWHFHPEYEIVYITNGSGKRHIGNHISHFQDGLLIMLGPELPHLSFSQELREDHNEAVVQLKMDFLGRDLWERPEMKPIVRLFERARQGISFNGPIKHEIGQRLIKMEALGSFERVIELLSILKELAQTEDFELHQAQGWGVVVNAQDRSRIESVYTYVQEHFKETIPLEDIAKVTNMTVPAFCRYLKKLTGKTFTQIVNEFRIGHACTLLSEAELPISEVAFECGFNNLSHFNRQFKQITDKSPSEYRKEWEQVVEPIRA